MSFLDRFWRPRRTPGAWHARMAVQLASVDREWEAERAGERARLALVITDREIDLALAHMHDVE
jgi:hypothetical protein